MLDEMDDKSFDPSQLEDNAQAGGIQRARRSETGATFPVTTQRLSTRDELMEGAG